MCVYTPATTDTVVPAEATDISVPFVAVVFGAIIISVISDPNTFLRNTLLIEICKSKTPKIFDISFW